MDPLVKIIVFVPVAQANQIREVLASAGAGRTGNYEACSFSVKGTGRFRPLDGAHPAIGTIGRLEEVEEERIETVCYEKEAARIVKAVRKAHPYEAPVIDVVPLKSIKHSAGGRSNLKE